MKKEEKKPITITKEQALRNIAEWLYVNDGRMLSKNEWREALLLMLEWNIKRVK